MRQRVTEHEAVPYMPPEPALSQCTCGALVLTRVWVMGEKERPGRWRELPEAVSPVCGWIHPCAPLTHEKEV